MVLQDNRHFFQLNSNLTAHGNTFIYRYDALVVSPFVAFSLLLRRHSYKCVSELRHHLNSVFCVKKLLVAKEQAYSNKLDGKS